MAQGFRIIVETYDITNNLIIDKSKIIDLKLKAPSHIKEVGLNHLEQIDLLQKILDILVPNQCALLEEENIVCPKCGKRPKRSGEFFSKFHSVYTDHKVKMLRKTCTCGWKNKYTIEGKYGISSHPDLLKMQSEVGSEQSYMKAQDELTRKNGRKRQINNHMHISRTIEKVGSILSNLKSVEPSENNSPSNIIVAQIDGGHIKPKDKHKRSIEAIAAKIYDPKNIRYKDQNHNELLKSTCVASALSDRNITIKKQTIYAAKREGMTKETIVYLISDGANNCWSAGKTLKPYCKQLIPILDWSHIGRKFKNAEQKLPENYHEKLDRAKWCLWHGQAKRSLEKLNNIKISLSNEQECEKLDALIKYISNNIDHIINYKEQSKNNLPFTSSIIESGIESIINERQGRTKKMQWTREGAHNILQIRTSQASKSWDSDWEQALEVMLAA